MYFQISKLTTNPAEIRECDTGRMKRSTNQNKEFRNKPIYLQSTDF